MVFDTLLEQCRIYIEFFRQCVDYLCPVSIIHTPIIKCDLAGVLLISGRHHVSLNDTTQEQRRNHAHPKGIHSVFYPLPTCDVFVEILLSCPLRESFGHQLFKTFFKATS